MNRIHVYALLEEWEAILNNGQLASLDKATKTAGGLDGRIKRTTGRPVIFDIDSYAKQLSIQNYLCTELPQFADLIRSKPEIMDGYSWIRGDFIELYYDHFRIVVEKLRRFIRQQHNV